MLRIISGTVGVILTIFIIILAIGLRMGSEVNTELKVYFPYDREYLYAIYTDIEEYPLKKNNLKNIEILEKDGKFITKWRENYFNGDWYIYEIKERNKPVTFDYEIIESSSGYTGKITHTFFVTDNFTELTMTEESNIPNTLNRGLRFVLGGDKSYLKSSAKWLRVAILNEQINRE